MTTTNQTQTKPDRDDPARNQLLTGTVGSGMVGLAPNWVILVPNGTNPGLFQIRFQCIWRGGGFVPFGANLTHFGGKPTIPEWRSSEISGGPLNCDGLA